MLGAAALALLVVRSQAFGAARSRPCAVEVLRGRRARPKTV